jgi:AcrR family transcriptional regulator
MSASESAPGRSPQRRTGRPPITSQRELVAAGWQVGIDRLSIGQVTKTTGVRYSTFYRYFSDFEALITAMIDDAFTSSGAQVPGSSTEVVDADVEDLRTAHDGAGFEDLPGLREASAALDRTARQLNTVLDDHPGLGGVLVTRPWPAPPLAAIRESLIGKLTAAGVPTYPATAAADLLVSSIVCGHLNRAAIDTAGPDISEVSQAQLVLITIAMSRHL